MGTVLVAILPVFLLIFLGNGLKSRGLLVEGFWDSAERLTYFVLLPALLVVTLAGADFSGLGALPMAAAIALAVLLLTGAVLLARPLLGLSGPAFTSLYQGLVRQNTYIGLAICFAVYGTPGLAPAAVAIAVLVPVTNLISVSLLVRFGSATAANPPGLIGPLLRNPMILACALGIFLNLTGIGLPPVIKETLEILARAALPLGLLTVGAGLDLGAARASGPPLVLAVAGKLILLPLLTALVCLLFGVTGIAAFAAILFNGLPTATSTYILARQMGGDAKLMASIVTLQVIASLLTLPVILLLLT